TSTRCRPSVRSARCSTRGWPKPTLRRSSRPATWAATDVAAQPLEPTGVIPTARRDAMPPALLGVILFVASECVFFAALFGAYFTVRAQAPIWPPKGIAEGLKPLPLPTIATAILILSSFTMQFAVQAIRMGDRRTMMRLLKVTLVMGA